MQGRLSPHTTLLSHGLASGWGHRGGRQASPPPSSGKEADRTWPLRLTLGASCRPSVSPSCKPAPRVVAADTEEWPELPGRPSTSTSSPSPAESVASNDTTGSINLPTPPWKRGNAPCKWVEYRRGGTTKSGQSWAQAAAGQNRESFRTSWSRPSAAPRCSSPFLSGQTWAGEGPSSLLGGGLGYRIHTVSKGTRHLDGGWERFV